jgi:hypothetical protein
MTWKSYYLYVSESLTPRVFGQWAMHIDYQHGTCKNGTLLIIGI